MQQYLFLDNIYMFSECLVTFPHFAIFPISPENDTILLFGIILLCHADQFTIFESTGLIHLDQLHPISGLLP